MSEDKATLLSALNDFMIVLRSVPPTTIKRTFPETIAQAVLSLRTRCLINSALEKQTNKKERRLEKARQMANAIIRNLQDRGECTVNDLLYEGFTDSEIRDLSLLAVSLVSTSLPLKKTLN